MTTLTPLRKLALRDALLLFIPAIPFGLVVGLAITESGMSPLLGWATAPIIFGGAAQLTYITLLGSGAALAAAVTAALIINARHVMYSAALAPTFQRQPRWFRWLGPYFLIDQLFALVTVRIDDDPDDFRAYYLAAGCTFSIMWMITVALGLVIGPIVPEEWHLEFAAAIVFIGLIVIGIDRWTKALAAVVGAGATFVFAGLPNRGGLLVGAVLGVLAGTMTERFRK
jgi:predicted branched-subunit amino acid permease